jgi:hypothetical protein
MLKANVSAAPHSLPSLPHLKTVNASLPAQEIALKYAVGSFQVWRGEVNGGLSTKKQHLHLLRWERRKQVRRQ